MRQLVPIECKICGQPAHGYHFSVLSCRACIEFYRRSIKMKKKFKCMRTGNCIAFKNGELIRKCKGCRFEQCQKAGMQIIQSENGKNGQKELKESNNPNKELTPHLRALKNSFEYFLDLQNANFIRTSNLNVFDNPEILWNFEENTKTIFVKIFEKSVDIFSGMKEEEKFELVGKCLAQINFLAACQRTLKHFPSANDGRFFVAHGLVLDMAKLNRNEAFNKNEDIQNRNLLIAQKRLQIVKNLKTLPYSVQKIDIYVLATLLLTNKASKIGSNNPWNAFKEIILTEWLQNKISIFGNAKIASIQIGRLLSFLAQLDLMITKECPIPSKGQFQLINQNLSNYHSTGTHFIEYFLRLLSCHRRIWNNFRAFDDNYLNKFQCIEDLLVDLHENVLAFGEALPISELPTAKRPLKAKEIMPPNSWNLVRKAYYVSKLISLGILKAMPAFKQIGLQDRILLVQYLCTPIFCFINSFYSFEFGANTWIRPAGGWSAIGLVKMANKEFGKDQRLMQIAEKAFTRPVQRFHEMKPILREEEFVLLLAILCFSSNISGLSAHARDLLYAHQTFYSRIFLQNLQKNLGMEQGAKRFADCLFLMECAFQSAQNHDALRVYVNAFHGENHPFCLSHFPKCIAALM